MPTIEQAVSYYTTALSLEWRSPEYTDWLRRRLGDFTRFLQASQGQTKIGSLTIEQGREFIKNLMERKTRYQCHKLRREVEGGLALTTIHGYVRAMRSFSSWLY